MRVMNDNVDYNTHIVNKKTHGDAEFIRHCVSGATTAMFTETCIDGDMSHGHNRRMADTASLGTRLKEWRKARKLTQAQLARLAGLAENGRQTIGNIENGGNPNHATVAALASALGITTQDLMGKPVLIGNVKLSQRAVAFAEMFDDLADDLDRDAAWNVAERFPRRSAARQVVDGQPETIRHDSPRTVSRRGDSTRTVGKKLNAKRRRTDDDQP